MNDPDSVTVEAETSSSNGRDPDNLMLTIVF
jgi:hypothetical protein